MPSARPGAAPTAVTRSTTTHSILDLVTRALGVDEAKSTKHRLTFNRRCRALIKSCYGMSSTSRAATLPLLDAGSGSPARPLDVRRRPSCEHHAALGLARMRSDATREQQQQSRHDTTAERHAQKRSPAATSEVSERRRERALPATRSRVPGRRRVRPARVAPPVFAAQHGQAIDCPSRIRPSRRCAGAEGRPNVTTGTGASLAAIWRRTRM